MPKTRQSRKRGAYHYAKRKDGTKYRVYHSGHKGKGSRGKYAKKTAYKRSKRGGGGTIRGYGAYRMSGRSLNPGTQIPQVKNSRGGFCVQHKEFIGDVPASQAFALASLPINPGMKQTFPWLSQLAENFEEWKPKGIVFMFKTTSSNAVVSTNSNAGLGTVIMATEYNVANPSFGNKQQMENYEGAVSCDPSKSMLHTVESSKAMNPLGIFFVRTGAPPANTDRRFYDLGDFEIATVGMQSNGNLVGELWVSYDIELMKPRILTGQPLNNEPAVDHFSIVALNATTVDTTILPAVPFGTITAALRQPNTGSTLSTLNTGAQTGVAVGSSSYLSGGIVPVASQPYKGVIPVLDGNGNPTGVFGDSTANTYYFPPGITSGDYLIQYTATYGTGGTANWVPTVTPTNCVALPNLFTQDSASGVANTGTAAVTTTIFTFCLRVTKANAKFTMTGTTGTFANPAGADLFIIQLPPGLN